MKLSRESVAWLRTIAESASVPALEAASVATTLRLLARRTPACREPFDRLTARLGLQYAPTGDPVDGLEQFTAEELATLGSDALPASAQLVDVEFPEMVFRRAEWRHGGLFVDVDVAQPDPARWTLVRLVGAEPRVWCYTGIDGVTTDATSAALLIRIPWVSGPMEFLPGSY